MTALRYGLLGAAFLAGMLTGLYAAAVITEGHAQSPEVAYALDHAADTHGISRAWLRRLAWCESRFDPAATSWAGAQGLLQFMPRTWTWMSWRAGYGGASPYDPWSAAHVGAWALRNGYAGHWVCR